MQSFSSEPVSVLTKEKLQNAYGKIVAYELIKQCVLKDFSKLKPFFERLEKSDKSTSQKAIIEECVQKLASGNILVLPKTLHKTFVDYLASEWLVPKEILDNILC